MDGLVDVVVVTADTPEETERCVAALADGPIARTVVVDNGPRREAGRRIRQRFLTVEVVDLDRPAGFAAACNAGAARGSAPYVLFLNSDVIARPGAIAALRDAVGARDDVVGAGGRLVDPGPGGATQPAYEPQPFPGLVTLIGRATGLAALRRTRPSLPRYDETHTVAVDQPAGAAFLVRRDALEAIGGFDERFWFWYEDVDLALRLHARGRLLHVPGAVFEHLGGESFKAWSHARGVRSLLHGLLQYAGAHLGGVQRAVLGAAIVASSTPRAVLFGMLPGATRRELAAAHADAASAAAALMRGAPVPSIAPVAPAPPRACPLCGAGDAVPAYTARDRNRATTRERFAYERCTRCETRYLDPVPDDLAPFYAGYHPLPDGATLRAQAEAEAYKLDVLRVAGAGPGARVVEVGPSVGAFCLMAREAGHAVTAIEMDPTCVEHLRETVGVEAIQSAAPHEALAGLRDVDVIALWQVLEHLPEPDALLRAAARALRPGGILVLATPNPEGLAARALGGLWPHVDAPRHLQLMPAAAVQARAGAAGLRTERRTGADGGEWPLNRFGWENVLTARGGAFLVRALGVLQLGPLVARALAPVERRGQHGSSYTLVLRRTA